MSKLLKYARLECERRFLLAALPARIDPDAGYRQIRDLYIEGTRLRLRSVSSPEGERIEQKLNQKLPPPSGEAAHRIVTSVYLDPAEYARLAALPGRRLEKRRYAYTHEGRAFAIDAFGGPLAGLVLAEIALDSEAELRALPLPAFAHCEVTELPLFTGGELAHGDPARVAHEARRLLSADR
jgi:CYTH domain-containing protein